MINCKYDIGQEVYIKDISVKTVILSIHKHKTGIYYTVRYFNNGEIVEVELLESELGAK